jgi:hypothetical protein
VRRREVIACLGAAGFRPFAAHAQQPSQLKRLAIIDPTAPRAAVSIGGNRGYAIFFEQMKRLGYVEGGNHLIVERYCLEGRLDRFPEIVHEIVVTRPMLQIIPIVSYWADWRSSIVTVHENALVSACHTLSRLRSIPCVGENSSLL